MCKEDKAKKIEERGAETEIVHKTSLKEVTKKDSDKKMDTNQVLGIMAELAKRAALTMIQDELELYKGLIDDAEMTDEKLKIIREVADLKLRSVGVCLAGMRMTGKMEVPNGGDVSSK
ncbi:MAG: hypothetical protein GY841_15650 [FCB group bacterium]|nr:hypothetical protein [FCB group bacterium]